MPESMMPNSDQVGSGSEILSCQNIWKLFGPHAETFLVQNNNDPTNEVLSKSGLTVGVRDATLKVHKGEIFVIMGLSGSGKSTIVRLLSRLIEPTSGQIIFQGTDLLKASRETLIELRRHKMGMVFQHFALLPHLRILDNVAFPLEIQGVDRAKRLQRAQDLIELVGLKGKEQFFPRELSGGQQQRVGIARSLAVEPDIWFLDEPFSALDPLIRAEMQTEFLRLQNLLNKTIVFITHDFDEAIRLADRIAIMKDGKIIQVGTPEELIMAPADDHVTEFTRNIPRARVLTAKSVMNSSTETLTSEYRVSAEQKIQDIAEEVMHSDMPISVEDRNGNVIGEISRATVTKILLNQDPFS